MASRVTLLYLPLQRHDVSLGMSLVASALARQGVSVEQAAIDDFRRQLTLRTMLGMPTASDDAEPSRHASAYASFRERLIAALCTKHITHGSATIDNAIDRAIPTPPSSEVIGISVHSIKQLLPSLAVAKRLKERTGSTLILGGACIELYAGCMALQRHRFIDGIGIAGLEHALGARIDRKLLEPGGTLPSYLEGKQLDAIREDERLTPLDGLPFRLTSGCKHQCAFCNRTAWKRPTATAGAMARQLAALHAHYRCNRFRLVDECVNADPDYLEQFCSMLARLRLPLRWTSNASPTIDPGLLRRLRRAGCTHLIYGIESGSDAIIARMRKPFRTKRAARCLQETGAAGISAAAYFIVGYPGENEDDITATERFLSENRNAIDTVYLFRFSLRHRSPMQLRPSAYGLTLTGQLSPDAPHVYRYDERTIRWQQRQRLTTARLTRLGEHCRSLGLTTYTNDTFQ